MTTDTPPSALAPATPDELADAVREASLRGETLVPWGAGTRQHIGNPPAPGALLLRTTGLNRVVEHIPADMTVTVEAGASLGELQALLARHGQWLPWDPPADGRATIGGLLATAAAGPLRLGYGVPRDWVLGMRVALGDGRLVKSGGKVVKNVAGYDTHKLHIGALGTLGVIVELTCKVFPLPERSGTLLLACPRSALADLVERLRAAPLAPISLCAFRSARLGAELPAPPDNSLAVAVRYAGVRAAVDRQLAAARTIGVAAEPLDDEPADRLWQRLAAFPAPDNDGAVILRAGAPPSALAHLIDALDRHAPGGPSELLGYGGVGLAFARWQPAAELPAALSALRAELAATQGYAVVEHAPPALGPSLDLWGPPPETLGLMRALKQQWDPHNVLNRGRYLAGL